MVRLQHKWQYLKNARQKSSKSIQIEQKHQNTVPCPRPMRWCSFQEPVASGWYSRLLSCVHHDWSSLWLARNPRDRLETFWTLEHRLKCWQCDLSDAKIPVHTRTHQLSTLSFTTNCMMTYKSKNKMSWLNNNVDGSRKTCLKHGVWPRRFSICVGWMLGASRVAVGQHV